MLVTCLGFLIHKKALCQRGSRCSVVGHSADGDTFSSLWFCFFYVILFSCFRRGGFVFTCVLLLVCQQDYVKTTEQISTKDGG